MVLGQEARWKNGCSVFNTSLWSSIPFTIYYFLHHIVGTFADLLNYFVLYHLIPVLIKFILETNN